MPITMKCLCHPAKSLQRHIHKKTKTKRNFARLASIVFAISLMPMSVAAGECSSHLHNTDYFQTMLGVKPVQVQDKLESAWHHFFEGDIETQRIYYEVDLDMAYIADIGNQDVRSEGMSYGMMIAVMMDRKDTFDRLWKWAKTYMYHAEGGRSGYFAWHCSFDGTQLSDASASDGEEWIAMALLFAANRWGNGDGIYNYKQEANQLLSAMLHKTDPEGYLTSIFDKHELQPVFVPHGKWATFTDPSYHLPAFYQLWSCWAESDQETWQKCMEVSRRFFHKSANSETGLMPDYAHFDGSPRMDDDHKDFRFDAWRTISNVALDWSWNRADPWQVEQTDRVLTFLLAHFDFLPNQFALDGTPLSEESSLGLYAMAATGALATSDPSLAKPFVEHLWEAELPKGKWRYYDGLTYFLALLQVSGNFKIYTPQTN